MHMGSRVFDTPEEAVADVSDGTSIAVGGFGLCGIPDSLIRALADSGVGNLETFSNNCGVDDQGLGYAGDGSVPLASPPNETRVFGSPSTPALRSSTPRCRSA